MHFPLMGLSFRPREAKEIVATLEKGDILHLQRDRHNEYDSNAVRIIYRDENEQETWVGFVPKEQNADIASFLDEQPDGELTVQVTGIADPKKPTLYFDESQMEDIDDEEDEHNGDDEEDSAA